jgi:two-component system NtrC family sensor kinase
VPQDEGKNERLKGLAQQIKEKEAIINGISDTLMLLDAETYKILEANKSFLDTYGLSRDQVVGKTCHEVTHHLDRPCHQVDSGCPCPLEDSIATGNLSHVEHVHKDHEGQNIYFEISAYPLKDATGQVSRIIHISRDITPRKRLELQFLEKEKLGGILELAGAASHEINQPLTVIIKGLEQLVKRLKKSEAEHELAQMILDNARRLAEISEKLGKITRYASKDYVAGKRILDLDEASKQESEH